MIQEISCSRDADRTRVLMVAKVFASDGARQVRVRDISLSGAQVTCNHAMPINGDVIFKRGTIFAAARIVWSNERQTGLKFYRDLEPDELNSTFHTVLNP